MYWCVFRIMFDKRERDFYFLQYFRTYALFIFKKNQSYKVEQKTKTTWAIEKINYIKYIFYLIVEHFI